MAITIFSSKNCVKCNIMKRKMEEGGIDFNEVDIDEDKDAVKRLMDAGFRQLPVFEENGKLKQNL